MNTKSIAESLSSQLEAGNNVRLLQRLDEIAEGELQAQRQEINRLRETAENTVNKVAASADARAMELGGALARAREEIAQKDALILEWMHSNEAFKMLARRYGNQLGLNREQRILHFNEEILNVSKDNEKYSFTKLHKGAEDSLKNSKS